MKFKKIENSNSEKFNEAWSIYESSFPSDERRSLESQLKLMKNKLYNFFGVFEKNVLVAVIAYWNFGNFLFIENLAVKTELRDIGIGTRLLEEYLIKNKKKIVLEVERLSNKIAIKRIKFYKKIGFKLNKYNYIHPPYGKGKNPIPMFLMTYPKTINKSEFSLIREKVHTTVYGYEKPLF